MESTYIKAELTQDEFNALNMQLDVTSKLKIEKAKKLLSEVEQYHKAYILYTMRKDKLSVFMATVYLDLDLQISVHSDNSNLYYFICETFHRFTNLKAHEVTSIALKNDLERPIYKSKLTEEFIKEYIDYCEKVFAIVAPINRKNRVIEEVFKEKLKGFEVFYDDDSKKTGSISKNGIVYNFEIENGYITENLEIAEDLPHDLENYCKLIDNGFSKAVNRLVF